MTFDNAKKRPWFAEWEKEWVCGSLESAGCPPRDITIFRMWLDGKTFKEIGILFHITPERVRQLHYRCKVRFDYHTRRADLIVANYHKMHS